MATDIWNGSGVYTTNWNTLSQWSAGLPGSSSAAIVENGGTVIDSTTGAVTIDTLSVSGTLSAPAAVFVQSGGSLTALGNVTINAEGGLLVNYSLPADGLPQSDDPGSTLIISGTLTNSGGTYLSHGIGIGNETGGGLNTVYLGALVNATSTAGVDIANADVTIKGNVTNDGRGFGVAGIGIGFFPGETSATVTVSGSFVNNGALGVASGSDLTVDGTLTNSGGNTNSGGVLISGTGTSATFGALVNTSSGGILVESGGSATVTGNVTNSGLGTHGNGIGVETDAGLTVDGSVANGGAFGVFDDSTLTVSGTFTNSGFHGSDNGLLISGDSQATLGTLINTSTGSIDVADSDSTLTVSGNVTNSGAESSAGIGVAALSGDTGGTLTVDDAFTNAGNFDIGNSGITGSAAATVSGALSNTSAGKIGIISGTGAATLTVDGGIANHGTIFGTGEIDGNVTNSATILGGVEAGSTLTPGTLTIDGNYTQAATGVVDEVLDTSGMIPPSTINVTGAVDLAGGTLDVKTPEGIGTPRVGKILPVMSFTPEDLSGSFSAIEYNGVTSAGQIFNLGSGLEAQIEYDNSAGTITLNVVNSGVTDTWIGSSGVQADWNTSGDWTPHIPGAVVVSSTDYTADTALIKAGGNVSVSGSDDITIGNLSIGPFASGSQANLMLVSGGQLTVSDNATNSGSLSVDAGSSGGSGSTLTVYGTFTNAADEPHSGGFEIGNSAGASETSVTIGTLVNTVNGGINIQDATVTVLHNVTNAGDIVGTAGIGVDFEPGDGGSTLNVGGTFTNSGAFGIGNTSLSAATSVTVGGLDNTASGQIDITGNSTTPSNSATLFVSGAGTNAGQIEVSGDGDAALILGSSFANSGTITLSGSGVNPVELGIDGPVTLTGGGKVTLGGPDGGYILLLSGSATLTNVNNTIAGVGGIGALAGTLTFINSGTVDANVSSGYFLADAASITNNFGVLEATSAGTLYLGAVNNSKTIEALGTNATVELLEDTVTNASSGVILASGTGATIQLDDATIRGGKLETAASGLIETVSGTSDEISGVTIASSATVEVVDSGTLALSGTIANSGTIALSGSGANPAELAIDDAVTLTGGGKVTLSGSPDGDLVLLSGSATLTNVNNTIAGEGVISGPGTFINSGTVDANVSSGGIAVAANSVTNFGILEATSGGLLGVLSGTLNNSKTIEALGTGATVLLEDTVTNASSAVILASGAGATIQLNSATIVGGKLETSAGGVIDTLSGSTNAISGATITSGATIDVVSSSTLTLSALAGDGGDFFGNSGTIDGNLDTSGTLEAGSGTTSSTATPGLLTIDGNYAASGGKLIEAVSGASGGRLDVTGSGTADLAGGTLDVVVNSNGGALAVGTSYEVLSATSGIIAPLSAIEYNGVTSAGQIIDIGSGLALQAVYSGNEVTLDVVSAGVTDTWVSGSGDWTKTSGWTPREPGGTNDTADTAVISAGGNVSVSGSDGPLTVGSLSISSGASLALVSGGQFAVSDNVTNGGTLSVDGTGSGGSTLNVDGTLTNSHTFTIGSGSILSAYTTVTLSGLDNTASGTIDLTGNDGRGSVTLSVTGAGTNAGQINVNGEANGELELDSSFTNRGTIALSNGAELSIASSFANSGAITLNSESTLFIDGTVTLTGGGTVTLTANPHNNYIFPVPGSAATLINVNNTIAGAGTIELTTIVNSGTVDANTTSALTFEDGSVTNFGILEATSAGTLGLVDTVNNSKTIEALGTNAQVTLYDTVTNASSAVILASGSGATIRLNSATILGGKLETSAGGVIETVSGTSDEISGVTITSGATVEVVDSSTLTLVGTLANSGTIAVSGNGDPTALVVSGAVTLTGGGKVTLGGSAFGDIEVSGGTATLTNVNNTIAGYGGIGAGGTLTFINSGTVDANSSGDNLNDVASVTNNFGVLEATSAGTLGLVDTVNNSKTIEALGTNAQVTLYDTVTNASSAVILASGSGATIRLNSATILGGKLETSAGGVIETVSGTSDEISGVTITSGATVEVVDSSTLTLVGTLANSGTIAVSGNGDPTALVVSGAVTLTGGGKVTLGGSAFGDIEVSGGTATLTNVNNTIAGYGGIGAGGTLTFINSGTVDANSSGDNLNDVASVTNNFGVLEATSAGTLGLVDTVNNSKTIEALGTNAQVTLYDTVTNASSAVILASGSGATIRLNSATILGGKLETSAGGVIETVSGTSDEISGVTITSGATVEVVDSSTLTLVGTLANSGTIAVSGNGDPTALVVSGAVTLTGGGKVTLGGSAFGDIEVSGGTATLTNVNNTIAGYGGIGAGGTLTFINSGTVDANSSGDNLNDVASVTNNFGVLEATSAGTLGLVDTVNNSKTIEALGTNAQVTLYDTVTNASSAVILASGSGATIRLNSATILGGKLETSAGGVIETVSGTSDEISGVTITSGATVEVVDSSTLTLVGTLANSGTIAVSGNGDPTALVVSGAVTLTGGGKVTLGGSAFGDIEVSGGTATLTNVNNTIAGYGGIGAGGTLTFINSGTVDANSSGDNLNDVASVTNNFGVLEATSAGTLGLVDTVNNSKTIEALGTNAQVTLYDTVTNASSAVILASGSGATIRLNSATILGGKLETSAGGVIETVSGTSDEISGVTITSGATVEVVDSSTLTLVGTLANSGTIAVSGNGDPTALVVSGAVTLTGGGKVTLGGSAFGDIEVSGGTATLTNVNNTIAGYGGIGAGGTLTFINSGTVDANSSGDNLNDVASVTNNFGVLEATSAGTLGLVDTVNNSKTIEALGTNAQVTLYDTVTNASSAVILASGSGATIRLNSATILGGKLETSAGGVIETVSGTSDEISGVTITSGATVEVVDSSTLTLVGTLANSGTLYASGSGSLIDIAADAVVSGGKAEVGDGTVEIDGASNEAVSFTASGSGGLLLEDTGSAYTGKISGFGPVDGGTTAQFIDFAGVDFIGESFTYTPLNAADTSGTLSVTDGTHSASVILVGHYTSANFTAHSGVGGSLEITDPTTVYTSAYVVSSGKSIKASDDNLVFLSNLTVAAATAEVVVSSGGYIGVQGTTTVTSGLLATVESPSSMDLEGNVAVTNGGILDAAAGDITIQGTLTNSSDVEAVNDGAIDIQSSVSNTGTIATYDYSVLTMAQNVSNTGNVVAYNDSVIEMGGGGAATNTYTLTNRDLIYATDESTIDVNYGSGGSGGVVNQGVIQADDSASLFVTGGSTLTNHGSIQADGDSLILISTEAGLVNSGTILADSGTIMMYVYSNFANDGVLQVQGTGDIYAPGAIGGIAELDGTGDVNNTSGVISGAIDSITLGATNTAVSFGQGDQGELVLTAVFAPDGFTGNIEGFTAGDAIVLTAVPYSAGDEVKFYGNGAGTGGTLDVLTTSNTLLAQLDLVGVDPTTGEPYTDSSFYANSDGKGGIIITDPSVTIQNGNAPATIANGEILDIDKPDSGNVTFAASSGTLVLDDPSTFTGTVAGFGGQDGLDLTGIDYGANTTLAYAPNSAGTGGILSISDGTHAASIALLGSYIASSFATAPDGHGGTFITDPALTAQNPTLTSPHAA